MSSPAATLSNVTRTARSRRLYQPPRLRCLLLELLNAPFPIGLQLCVLQHHLPPDVLLERHIHLLFREARQLLDRKLGEEWVIRARRGRSSARSTFASESESLTPVYRDEDGT